MGLYFAHGYPTGPFQEWWRFAYGVGIPQLENELPTSPYIDSDDYPGAGIIPPPRKGKPNELTKSDLEAVMKEYYEIELNGVDKDDFNWMNADTIFHYPSYTNERFIYEGNIFKGEEINYIAVGMTLRHYGYRPLAIVFAPHYHNLFNNDPGHWATYGEITFTRIGYWSYYSLIYPGKEDPYAPPKLDPLRVRW